MMAFWDAVTLAEPHKQSAPCSRQITTPTPCHSMFTGRMLFLTPNQQCQSTEGKKQVYETSQNRGNGARSETPFV